MVIVLPASVDDSSSVDWLSRSLEASGSGSAMGAEEAPRPRPRPPLPLAGRNPEPFGGITFVYCAVSRSYVCHRIGDL